MGCITIATEIVKDPGGCSRKLPRLLPVGCKIGFRTDWTIDSRSGPVSLCFVFCSVSQRHVTVQLATVTIENGQSLQR